MHNKTEHNNVVINVVSDDVKKTKLVYSANEVLQLVKEFCERTKMIANSDEKIRKAIEKGNNVRLCNYGKTDTCRTVSVWYAPKRYEDIGVRIEAQTLKNLIRADANKFLLEHAYKATELHESSKDDEMRYSFKSVSDAFHFIETLQANYRQYKADSETKTATKTAEKSVMSA